MASLGRGRAGRLLGGVGPPCFLPSTEQGWGWGQGREEGSARAPTFRKLYCLNVASCCDHSRLLHARLLELGATEEPDSPISNWLCDLGRFHHLLKPLSPSVKGGSEFQLYPVSGFTERPHTRSA